MGTRLRRAGGPLALAGARFRRRPGRWLLPALGIAVVTAFACAVAGQGSVAADRAAHSTLAGLSPAASTVKVTAQGGDPAAEQRVRSLLARPGFGALTKVTLLYPVRLGGTVVQVAAIAPLSRWSDRITAPASAPCLPSRCPVLLAGGPAPRGNLALAGAAVRLAGRIQLNSSVPLGFRPLAAGVLGSVEPAAPPLLLSGDPSGLERLPGLQAIYRTTSWLAALDLRRLHSWELASVQTRLRRAQADLVATDTSLSFSAPFDGLDAARTQAAAAPRRLLLAGGGAVAVMVAFVLLAAGALRGDMSRELVRLQTAGATRGQRALLTAAEAAGVSALGAVGGAAAGLAVVVALSSAEGEPVGAILAHSVGTAHAAAALAVGWLVIALLLGGALMATERRGPVGVSDVLALMAVAALALALARGSAGGSSDPLPVLVAPLCCLAAGALVFRLCGAVLRGGERAARSLPFSVRLALVNLARAPAAAAGAAGFLAISVGLGAFALSYRATTARSAADQAAAQVPLDVTVSAGPSFTPPLAVAPLAQWRALTGGSVLPVRRTQASFPSGAATATVPMVALPAPGLSLLHGWRDSEASATRALLARRLIAPGPVRTPGPTLPATARALAVTAAASNVGVTLTAVLRDPSGAVTRLSLGPTVSALRRLRAKLPAGRWELAALGLNEPPALAATSGHQNAENAGADTRLGATIRIASVAAIDAGGRPVSSLDLSRWRGRGAAANPSVGGSGLTVGFSASGQVGVLRPPQPGDATPLPILVDPATAAQTGRDGRLPLTVDGVPITARVVGQLERFPTVGSDAGGFVVADEAALASRLDADAPGQGRPDELWLSARDLGHTRTGLLAPALASLNFAYRADIERSLRTDPVLTGVARTLELAALVAVLLAAVGLLTTLLGATRDRDVEHDLAAQGMGPRSLRLDLRLRMLLIAGLGVGAGLAVGVALARLAVAAVRGSITQAPPSPTLVTVVPWGQMALLGLLTGMVLAAVAWVATSGRVAGAGR